MQYILKFLCGVCLGGLLYASEEKIPADKQGLDAISKYSQPFEGKGSDVLIAELLEIQSKVLQISNIASQPECVLSFEASKEIADILRKLHEKQKAYIGELAERKIL